MDKYAATRHGRIVLVDTLVDDIFVQPFLRGQLDPASAEFRKAVNGYLAWELQLPEQLERAKETGFKLPVKKP